MKAVKNCKSSSFEARDVDMNDSPGRVSDSLSPQLVLTLWSPDAETGCSNRSGNLLAVPGFVLMGHR